MKKGFSLPAKRPRETIVKGDSTPAPVGGLNTRDPLASMGVQFATNLTNFIATPQGCSLRKGYRKWATGLPGLVESLLPYNGVGATADKLFAVSGTGIYDVTSAGAVGAAVVTGLSNARWEHTTFATNGGSFLIAVNGVNAPRHFNGSAWVTWTTVASPANPGEISTTGSPNISKWSKVVAHQRRLWFVESGTTKAWYLPINSVGGIAAAFDFGPAFPRGGNLQTLATWSPTAGDTTRNLLVAISDQGDVVLYEGTDPSDAAKWSIVGTWRLGTPVGVRCTQQFGGDLLYLSADGLQPLSKYMQSTNVIAGLTDNIQPTISSLTNSQQGLFGFELIDFISNNLLILNVPQINPEDNLQFVFNTVTKGWSLFTGWPAQAWASLNGDMYFGGNGEVLLAFQGFKDNANADGSGGNIYTGTAQQAFSYFERPGQKKRFVMARLNLVTATGNPNIAIGCNVDFNVTPPNSIGSATPVSSAVWGTSLWGVGEWSGGLQNLNQWQTIGGEGYAAAITIAVSSLAETLWVSTDWVYEPGGTIG